MGGRKSGYEDQAAVRFERKVVRPLAVLFHGVPLSMCQQSPSRRVLQRPTSVQATSPMLKNLS